MAIKPIRTDEEYEAALKEIEDLFDSAPGTPEDDRLGVLLALVTAYEEEHYPVPLPDPIEAIKYHMESRGLTRHDLEPFIGGRGRVSEILNRRRPLSLRMIRALEAGLGIPAEVLVQTYPLERDVEYYVDLPHEIRVVRGEHAFSMSIPALEGCAAHGTTIEEAHEAVLAMKREWIEAAFAEGKPIPEPETGELQEYSLRRDLRLPRFLYRRLEEMAEAEGTEISRLVVSILSGAVERRRIEQLIWTGKTSKPFSPSEFEAVRDAIIEHPARAEVAQQAAERSLWQFSRTSLFGRSQESAKH